MIPTARRDGCPGRAGGGTSCRLVLVGDFPGRNSTRSACNNEQLASALQPLATRGIAEVNAAAAEATINAAVDAAAESVSAAAETVAETVAAAAETVASGAAETVVERYTKVILVEYKYIAQAWGITS